VVSRLPLHDLHASAGATFAAPGGAELPLHYGDAAAEYAAVRQRVGLIDRSTAGVLEVRGRDRAAFLHAMLSNDIKSLSAGRGCAATFLDVHGKVQVVLFVWLLDDRILLVTPPAAADKAMQDLDKYLFSEKASFRDATGELSLLMLAGPDAPAVARRLTGASVPPEAWSHVTARLEGIDVRLVRGGAETGEPEVWVVVSAGEGARVWQALVGAGPRPVGLVARESLRLEAGTPLYGHDVDPSVLLPEIPSANLVSYTKGCYIGQEVVVRIRDRGHVNRHLRGLLLDGETVPSPGAAVLAGESEIGRVTSATWSFGLKRPIALGFLRRQHAEPGTPVAVRSADRTTPATVSALPFTR
jgi:folate-binding protein YgfZ